MFWRYHENAGLYALVDSNGKLIVHPDGGANYMIRCNSDGTFHSFETPNVSMVDDWGVREIIYLDGSMDADWSITVDGETLSYNGVFAPPVSEWVPIPAVEIFADQACTMKPTGEVSTVYAKINRNFGFDDEKSWPNNELFVGTPTTGASEDPYFLAWYTDFYHGGLQSINAGDVISLVYDVGVDVTGWRTEFYDD